MKKLFAMSMALVMSMAMFAGCGGGGGAGGAEEGIKGEVYDTGSMSVLVPEGWLAIPVMDMWAEEADAKDPFQLQICKGAESEWDILTCPYLQIIYYDAGTDMMKPTKDWYGDAADLEPIVIGETTWEGFTGTSMDKPLTVLFTGEAGGDQYQVTMWTEGSEESISVEDAEVLAILESIKPSA